MERWVALHERKSYDSLRVAVGDGDGDAEGRNTTQSSEGTESEVSLTSLEMTRARCSRRVEREREILYFKVREFGGACGESCLLSSS